MRSRTLRAPWYHPTVWLFAIVLGGAVGTLAFPLAVCAGADELSGLFGAVATLGAVLFGVSWRTAALVLTVQDEHLLVRWRGTEAAFRLDRVRAAWTGMGMGFVADEAMVVPVIGGPAQRRALVEALAELGVPLVETQTTADLSSEVREHTLDGMTLRLEPVYAPMPVWMVSVLALAVAGLVWAVGLVSMVTWDGSDAQVVVGIAASFVLPTLLCGAVVLHLWRRTCAVELTLSAHRLAVVEHTRLTERHTSVPLAEIEDLEHQNNALWITTRQRRQRITLPDRSDRTRRALGDLIDAHRARLEGSRDDVPRPLAELASRITERE
ncbi:MAG: hypothetical protein KC621_14950 [Myxococcales bacterium]|nr:hypothetical protein [Myxococcales bacterium]